MKWIMKHFYSNLHSSILTIGPTLVGAILLATLPTQSMEISDETKDLIRAEVNAAVEQTILALVRKEIPSPIKSNPQDGFDISIIKPYVSQIVKIRFEMPVFNYQNEVEEIPCVGHVGTGFMYDAQEGVICTNLHVVSNQFRGNIVVELDDGSLFDGSDIDILGTSPGLRFGDYAFLRVKKLSNWSSQAPLKADENYRTKRGDLVAFMGHSAGSFSIETGTVNDPFDKDSFGVRMDHRGGASGSPVFNRNAEIIGILHSGNDTHASILFISYVNRAYDQIKDTGSIFMRTLGYNVGVQKALSISRYHNVSMDVLAPFLSRNPEQGKNLFFVKPLAEEIVEGNPLRRQDVILTVNDQTIGIDYAHLTKLLFDNTTVTVKILRGNKIMDGLIVRPSQIESTFMECLMSPGLSTVYSVNSAFAQTEDLVLGSPILGMLKNVFTIQSLSLTPTPTFRDFCKALYKKVFEEHQYKFLLTIKSKGGSVIQYPSSIHPMIDMPYISQFNTQEHRWVNIPLSEYIQR